MKGGGELGRQSSEVWSGEELGKIQKFTFSLSTALSTALKPFPSSQSPMDFSKTHDGVNTGLICASKNTDAHFGAELSPYTWPREVILTLPCELINSVLDQEQSLADGVFIVWFGLRLC